MMLIKLNSRVKDNGSITDRDLIIKYAAKKLINGKIAILPTSTIYGISCVYNNKKSIERVYEIKQRPKDMLFIVLIPDISFLGLLAEKINRSAGILIDRYWLSDNPEPLTLVFKKAGLKKTSKNSINSTAYKPQQDTIAIRLDNLPEMLDILKLCGPVISTSATISGVDAAPKNIDEIPQHIKDNVDFIIDYKISLPGTASTILDVTGDIAVLLREGKLKYENIMEHLKNNQNKI